MDNIGTQSITPSREPKNKNQSELISYYSQGKTLNLAITSTNYYLPMLHVLDNNSRKYL